MRVLACCYRIIIVIVPWWCHLVIAYVIISSCSIVVFVGSLRYIVPFSKLMAQLPSKVPNVAMGTDLPASTAIQASWVDEFLDFSAAKRMALRRPVSDSLVLEAPVDGAGGDHEFDHLDDDQLMSMFSDEMPHSPSEAAAISLSKTLRTSDNSKRVEEKIAENEAEEAENICKLEHFEAAHLAAATEQIVDPKRAKRILANRQSAQRSRVRKLQYITELERSVTSLETEVSALSPRVAFLDKQRSLLTLGNRHLEQRIAALAQDKIFKDAHQEALKKEIERLRQVYYQQSLRKKADASSDTTMLTEELLSCHAAADCAPTT